MRFKMQAKHGCWFKWDGKMPHGWWNYLTGTFRDPCISWLRKELKGNE